MSALVKKKTECKELLEKYSWTKKKALCNWKTVILVFPSQKEYSTTEKVQKPLTKLGDMQTLVN